MTFHKDARAEFSELIGGDGDDASSLLSMQQAARTGKLKSSRLRSLHWKVFLGALSPEKPKAWRGEMARHRKVYLELSDRVQVNPSTDNEASLEHNNPLSTSGDSSWAKFFEDDKLRETIQNDIDRTHQEMEFFQKESTHQYMLNILFVWAKLNPRVSYRQGMHELLAVVLHVVAQEAVRNTSDTDLFAHLHDHNFIEHDTYYIYSKIMDVMGPYFQVKSGPVKAPSEFTKEQVLPVIAKCRELQTVLLPKASKPLAQHFKKLEIEPQIYALRWIRLMFSREFHLTDVCVFWDSIFAMGADLSFVDHLAIAMLLYVEEQLLSQEYTYVLRRLMRYPPVEDVTVIIRRALNVRDPKLYPLPQRQRAQRQLNTNPLTNKTWPRGAPPGLNNVQEEEDDPLNDGYSVLPTASAIRGSHSRLVRRPLLNGGRNAQKGAGGGPGGGGPQSSSSSTLTRGQNAAAAKFAQLKTSFSNRKISIGGGPSGSNDGGGGDSGDPLSGGSVTAPRPKSKAQRQQHLVEIESLRMELDKLQDERAMMATRLEEIVDKFQREFGNAIDRTSELLPEELQQTEGMDKYMLVDRDEFIESLAEVKQVRTVLSGFLDAHAVMAAIQAAKREKIEAERAARGGGGTPNGDEGASQPQSGPTIESDDEEPPPPQKVIIGDEGSDVEHGTDEVVLTTTDGGIEGGAVSGDQTSAARPARDTAAYTQAVESLFGTHDDEDVTSRPASSPTSLFGKHEEEDITVSLNPEDAIKHTRKRKKKKRAAQVRKTSSLIEEGFGEKTTYEESSTQNNTQGEGSSTLFSESVAGTDPAGELRSPSKLNSGVDLFASRGSEPLFNDESPLRDSSTKSVRRTPSRSRSQRTPHAADDILSGHLRSASVKLPSSSSSKSKSKRSRSRPGGSSTSPSSPRAASSSYAALTASRSNPVTPIASDLHDPSSSGDQQFIASTAKTSSRPMLLKKNATTKEYVPEITFDTPVSVVKRGQKKRSPKVLDAALFEETKPDLVGEESIL